MGVKHRVDSIKENNKKEKEKKEKEEETRKSAEQLRADTDFIAMVVGVEL